ncbi:MAG TPA: NAD(P)/FAD-dependent oxidoreductase [Blastocatellia bacterium]|nr:NAD(P)/FAD-dependent oxidoreductase [Blastocatellia bacterium]
MQSGPHVEASDFGNRPDVDRGTDPKSGSPFGSTFGSTNAPAAGVKSRPNVVIIGGGFGGLTAAKQLRRAPVSVALIDRVNHHLFQPLLYQVATAGLSPSEIASPIRSILSKQANVRVLLGEVTEINLALRKVRTREAESTDIPYDYLILATGAETNYFGNPAWAEFALGLKSLSDALEIRRRVLLAFEVAERVSDEQLRRQLLTFVVIGGGPTGVELAGSLAELSRFALSRDFRAINPKSTRIVLIEMSSRILSTFAESLSAKAVRQLEELGVNVRTGKAVTGIDHEGVRLGDEFILASTIVWSAGVRATPLTQGLGVTLDRGGRVLVEPDCSIPGHPEAFVIGDAAAYLHQGGRLLPGVSPVAMQQGRFVARNIARAVRDRPMTERFHYVDKGTMATIGRSRAITQIHRIRLSGILAWWTWLVVHLFFLVGFRNRLGVMFDWTYSYFTYKRGVRSITSNNALGRAESADTAPERPRL